MAKNLNKNFGNNFYRNELGQFWMYNDETETDRQKNFL